LTLLGAGVGLLVVPLGRAVAGSVRPDEATRASATNSAVAAVGGAFGVAGLTAIFSRYGSYSTAGAFTNGLDAALWLAAGLSAAASVVSLAIRGGRDAREASATVVGPPGPPQPVQAAGDSGEHPPQPMVPADQATHAPMLPGLPSRRGVDRPDRLPDSSQWQPDRPEETGTFTCPVCLGEGSFTMEPPQDPRTEICRRCYGHGKVLTGSHVPEHMVHECPDCQGRGYVERPTPESRHVGPGAREEDEPELYPGMLRRPADTPSGGVPE
jgi:hypothetical protein